MLELIKGKKIGPYPYRIITQLGKGEGGMSEVYLASIGEIDQPEIHNLVALKIAKIEGKYSQFYKDTLDNEIEHLRKLNHTGIVCLYKIHGQGLPAYPIYSARTSLSDNPWFSVMEYLSGGSLAELLKSQKKLDPGLALRIAYKLAKTLEYLHDQNCVHLDVKSENVVFRQVMTNAQTIDPVLIDFGIARAIGQVGLEAGSLQWLPPERVRLMSDHSLSPETTIKPQPPVDIYALGLLLYQMLTGRLPFKGSSKKITDAILRGNPTTPSSYNKLLKTELDELVLSAMAKEPYDRPTATQLVKELGELINRAEYQNYHIPPPPNRSNYNLFIVFISCLFTLAIVVTIVSYFNPQLLENMINSLGNVSLLTHEYLMETQYITNSNY